MRAVGALALLTAALAEDAKTCLQTGLANLGQSTFEACSQYTDLAVLTQSLKDCNDQLAAMMSCPASGGASGPARRSVIVSRPDEGMSLVTKVSAAAPDFNALVEEVKSHFSIGDHTTVLSYDSAALGLTVQITDDDSLDTALLLSGEEGTLVQLGVFVDTPSPTTAPTSVPTKSPTAAPVDAPAYTQNGAVESMNGEYTVLTFKTNGHFNLGQDTTVEYFMVGGGGAGGDGNAAGGGGAGGEVMYGSLPLLANRNYNVNIGAGGQGEGQDRRGNDGTSSSISGPGLNLSARGGGGGAGYHGQGGYGGGGSGPTNNSSGNYGRSGYGYSSGSVNTGAPNQGTYNSRHGNGGSWNSGSGVGGGGAGACGNGNSSNGNGGTGCSTTIDGSTKYYGGGGGGADYPQNNSPGSGGNGGGGRGAIYQGSAAVSGGANTGGGGGGTADRNFQNGNGGSGIVIIRF